ncbi:FHA domain-containing protein [Glaciihabitans sp. UYNi722]|uniref:FHA domain-containing protein n=1 Tax=Glaciihabitans sp. UYNi722 TaxID=3156344 RepID=UPI0033995943
MDKPGYITPPPGLIPESPSEISETIRVTERKPLLPVFVPAGPAVPPASAPQILPPAAVPTAPSPVVPVPQPTQGTPAVEKPQGQWSLGLHDGSVIHVSGTLLLGRDPARVENWTSAGLLRINDPEKSVSKTHAAIDCTGPEFWITDLFSTNGVAVTTPDGVESVLDPGERASIPSGSTIELGRYRMLVEAR